MNYRVYIDFNTMMQDPRERVWISSNGVRDGFEPGMRVMIYDETLETQANLEFDEGRAEWWAVPDWTTMRDVPLPGG